LLSTPARYRTLIGDGAAWICYPGIAFPEATRIVDLFHAREHLHFLIHSP
jgi:hypothetical protein